MGRFQFRVKSLAPESPDDFVAHFSKQPAFEAGGLDGPFRLPSHIHLNGLKHQSIGFFSVDMTGRTQEDVPPAYAHML